MISPPQLKKTRHNQQSYTFFNTKKKILGSSPVLKIPVLLIPIVAQMIRNKFYIIAYPNAK